MNNEMDHTEADARIDATVARRRRVFICLLLALLLPATAVVALLLLPVHWSAWWWPHAADTDTAESQAPPIVRQHLERALSDGEKGREGRLVPWNGGVTPRNGSRLWFGERHDRKGGSVRAICDETTGEIISFSREIEQRESDGDSGPPVHSADAAKKAAVRCLRSLYKTDPASWKLTVESPVVPPYVQESPVWVLRGSRSDRSFSMHLDSASGALLFYFEARVTRSGVQDTIQHEGNDGKHERERR